MTTSTATVQTRVRYELTGNTGTVIQFDGSWLLVQFDGDVCASSVHADDVQAVTDPV
jgi:hypothetical protein